MSEHVDVFTPMPDGPSEREWPRVVQQSAQTARSLAAERGVELVAPWHQSSEWGARELGGRTVTGWTLRYETRPVGPTP